VAAAVIGAGRARKRRNAVAGSVYSIGLAILLTGNLVHPAGIGLPVAALAADVSGARCVTADSPILLVVTGTLRRDIDAGCPLKLDPSGTSYDTDPGLTGRARSRPNQPEYQQAVKTYYASSDAALFVRLTEADGFTGETWAAIRAELPVRHERGPVTVLLRASP